MWLKDSYILATGTASVVIKLGKCTAVNNTDKHKISAASRSYITEIR